MNKTTFLKALEGDKSVRMIAGGKHCVAADKRTNKAICWMPSVNGERLRDIYNEAKSLGLKKPLKVFGHVSTVAESETFRFEQVAVDRKGNK